MLQTSLPNILFIMADQQRFDYLGCAGADFVNTPNIDRLAERGIRFTQCSTNIPVCAPTRVALASGLQPYRLGAVGNDCYLPKDVPTYYQHLRDHGYRVGCAGKLDLAKPDKYNGRDGDRPSVYRWGFTHPIEIEGKMHAGRSPTPLGPYGFHLQERGLYQQFHEDYASRARGGWIIGQSHDSVLPTDAFADVYIGRRATEWLEQIPDDFPWHHFVSFVGPHDPFDPPTEYANRYRDAEMPPPIVDDFEGKPNWITQKAKRYGAPVEEIIHTRRQYCAAIESIDDQVGAMLDALEARGMLDNTYIIFSSDHGEMLGDHGLYTKSVPYEASIRIPLIVSGPDIEGGQVSDALVELIDINPTICELAGLPGQPNLDARSFAPILCGESATHREDCLMTFRSFRGLRTHQYKLIDNYNDITELYDLKADPNELHNIAREQPEVVKRLKRQMMVRTMEGKWMR